VDDVVIERSRQPELSQLRELWLGVHRRHVESMPELAPYVDDDTSWAARSRLYAGLLAKPDTVLLLARSGAGIVGYGLAHVVLAPESWIGDTWQTASRVGEIESIGVFAP
jgi:hypothetical protein